MGIERTLFIVKPDAVGRRLTGKILAHVEDKGFRIVEARFMRLTRERDTRTLRYDWFLSRDGTQCGVREAYLSEEGLIEHNAHIMAARAELWPQATV